MKKRFLIPIFVIVALVTGLFLGTIGSAAIYNQSALQHDRKHGFAERCRESAQWRAGVLC